MNLRRYTFWLPVSLGLLLLLALLGWVWYESRPAANGSAKPKLAVVTFLKYSNAPNGQVVAWFCITNPTSAMIDYFPPFIMIGARDISPATSARPRSSVLSSHSSVAVSFAKPDKGEAWRVSVRNASRPSRANSFFLRGLRLLPCAPTVMDSYNFPTRWEYSTSEPRTD